MPKRYHDGRPVHHMGAVAHHAHLSDGEYSGYDDRRELERRDASMISEDHSAIANMPQNVIMREYPRHDKYLPEDLDDTISGIEHQRGIDGSKLHEHLEPKKV